MLKIGNVPVNQLVEQFGSPLYVYDVQIMQRAIDEYKKNFVSNNFATEILYASKAFTCKAMFKLIQQNNLSLDVVSGGEIYLASTINFDPKKLFFHGNNKPRHEMVEALKYGVGTFFVDNQPELDLLIQVSNELQISTDVIIRINPKVEAHTHDYVKTSIIDSKFGISMDYTEQIVAMINAVKNSQYLTMRGFHAHIGSQIFEYNGFEIEIDNMVRFMANINQLTNSEFSVLDLGGGFGVRYTAADQPKSYTETSRILIENVENACAKYHLNLTKLMIEPGRSIVGEAGYTVYTVGFTKKTDTKQWLFIDGGMGDNIRPCLYGSKYYAEIANRENEPKTEVYEVVGRYCESGDFIIHDCPLPKAQTGDLVVVHTTGAYGLTMASNYNMVNRLPVIFVNGSEAKMVVRRETYQDQTVRELE